MKPELIDRVNRRGMGFESIIPFILTRIIKVIALGMILSITFWLFWRGHFSLGAFFVGGIGGLLVFRILSFLKTQLSKSDIDTA
jgi:hypothetical protein